MGNYEKQIADLCHKMMTEQFLDYLNQCGCELGYPFVMYSNGECGKRLVSSDGKHNAVLKVLGSFKDNAKIGGIKKQKIRVNSVPLSSIEAQRLKKIQSMIEKDKHISADDECFLISKGAFRMFALYIDEQCTLSLSAFKIIVDENKLAYFATYMRVVDELGDDELDYILHKASREIMMIMFASYSSSFSGFSEKQEKKLVDRHQLDLLDVYDCKYEFEEKTLSYLRNLAQADDELKKWLDDRKWYGGRNL